MTTFNDLNEFNSTVITVNEATLKTTQDPHITDDGDMYTAPAIDAEGNEYILTWSIIDPEITDESIICDWDNPIGVTLVK